MGNFTLKPKDGATMPRASRRREASTGTGGAAAGRGTSSLHASCRQILVQQLKIGISEGPPRHCRGRTTNSSSSFTLFTIYFQRCKSFHMCRRRRAGSRALITLGRGPSRAELDSTCPILPLVRFRATVSHRCFGCLQLPFSSSPLTYPILDCLDLALFIW